MTEITTKDIRMQIRATKRRLVAAINEGRIESDFVVASLDYFGELQECITVAIEAGRDDEECDWGHIADMTWARYDVEDIITILAAILEEPTWD